MAKKKAKKATAKARKPDLGVWALPRFKALLDPTTGHLGPDSLKIIVENQRQINTFLYESIEAVIETVLADNPHHAKKASPLSQALALVRKVPGSGPPECASGGGAGR